MNYISARGGIAPVPFGNAVLTGIADNGGLFLPDSIPDATGRLAEWRSLPYADLACEIIGLYADTPAVALRGIVERSYSTFRDPDITRVVSVGPVFVLELFHGPTLAFKDLAMQFLGNLFEHLLGKSGASLNILAATSGDTGSAAIHGLRGRDGVRVFVLHPRGRISKTQERQMTTVLDDNVFNAAVEGTFDDCQRMVKELFSDTPFKRAHALGAVNSINWARVLAQIVYYFYAAFRVMDCTDAPAVRFAVPTGNFGNILAGYLAARMGLPIDRLVLATNDNDVLARFFADGAYRPAPVVSTPSPSMDIQVAGNFERYLYYRFGEDPAAVSRFMDEMARNGTASVAPLPDGRMDDLIAAGSADSDATLAIMREYHKRYRYLADPHTAVGLAVATRHMDEAIPMICLATAHPAKFGETIRQALGDDAAARHPIIDRLGSLAARCDVLPASVAALREYVAARVAEA